MPTDIKELIEKSGLSQSELSKRAGLTPLTVSNIKTGKTKNIRSDTLKRLASALGVKEEDVVVPVATNGTKAPKAKKAPIKEEAKEPAAIFPDDPGSALRYRIGVLSGEIVEREAEIRRCDKALEALDGK